MAADAALVVVDGVAGVEVQTEKVWAFAERVQAAPRHRDQQAGSRALRASSARSTASRQIFGRTAVPIQLPIGTERDFKGVVDLVRMKAYTYTPDGDGKGKEGEIPADLADAAQKAHEALVEMVAEGNDALHGRVLRQGHAAGRSTSSTACEPAVREMRIFPVLCASALHNIGTDLILNFIVETFPDPDRARRRERPRSTATKSSAQIADSEPVSAFVFKTVADPFAGRITYFKVVFRRGEERRQPAQRQRSSAPSAWRTSAA